MIKGLIETPSWIVVSDSGDRYIVSNRYDCPIGGTVFGLIKLDSKSYIEVDLEEFYRDFIFVSEGSICKD